MMLFFVILQIVLLLFMILHDWISIPPFNDVEALKSSDSNFYRVLGSVINGMTVFVPLIITLKYYYQPYIPLSSLITIIAFYLLLTVGTVLSWWVPYLFGSSEKHKQHFTKFKNTYQFLPARGDNVVPNALHVVLHLQVWSCLAIALYFLIGG